MAAVLLLTEVGLWVAQWAIRRAQLPPRWEGSGRVILCVGDSWTLGLESGDVKRSSYPARLQRLLDARLGAGRYKVINVGRIGATSYDLVQRIPDLLSRYRPDLVVLMIGGLNGHADRVPVRDTLVSSGSLLGRSKVVRMFRLLVRPPLDQQGRHQAFELTKLKRRLLREMKRWSRAGASERGLPPLSLKGCGPPEGVPARLAQLRALWRKGDKRAVEAMLEQEPSCAALHITAGELCRRSGDAACAKARAIKSWLLDRKDPRAIYLHAMVLEDHLATQGMLEQIVGRPSNYERAVYQYALRLVQTEGDACVIGRELARLRDGCPRCAWLAQVNSAVTTYLKQEGRLYRAAVLERRLAQDLTATGQTLSHYGLPVLMLNYPELGLDPCRSAVSEVIRSYARASSTELLELTPLFLGPDHKLRQERFGAIHPNAKGYAAMARAVLNRLLKLGWISKPARLGAPQRQPQPH